MWRQVFIGYVDRWKNRVGEEYRGRLVMWEKGGEQKEGEKRAKSLMG